VTGIGFSGNFFSSVESFIRGTQKIIRDLSRVANGIDTKSVERIANSIKTLRSSFFGGTDSKGNATRGLMDEISKFSAMKIPPFIFPVQGDMMGLLRGIGNFGRFAASTTKEAVKAAAASRQGQSVAGKGKGLASSISDFVRGNFGVDLSTALDKFNKSPLPKQFAQFAANSAKISATRIGNRVLSLIQPNETVRDIKAFGRFFGLIGKELSKAVGNISKANIDSLRTVAEAIDRFAKGVPLIIAAAERLPRGLFSNLPVVRFFKYKDFRSFLYFARYISKGLAGVAKIAAKAEGFENLGNLARSVSRFANAIRVINEIKLPQGRLGFLKLFRLNSFREFFVFARYAAKEFAKIGNIKNIGNAGTSMSSAVRGILDLARVMGDASIVATANANMGALKAFVRNTIDTLNPLSKLRGGGFRAFDFAKSLFPARSVGESQNAINRFGTSISKFGGFSKGFVSNLLGVNNSLKGNSDNFRKWSGSVNMSLQSVGLGAQTISRNLLNLGGINALLRSSGAKTALDFEDISTQLTVFGENIPLEEAQAFANEIGIKYPQSSAQALQAILDLAKAGQDLPDIKSILPNAADIAALGQIDLNLATRGLIQVVNSFDKFNSTTQATFENVEVGANILNAAANISTASVQSLLDAFDQIGPTASMFGIDMEQAAAIFALFEDSGVRASEAGTQLRTILDGLRKDESIEALRGLGLDLFDASGKLLPFNELIKSIAENLARMSDRRRIEVLGEITNVFGGRGLSILVEAGGIDATVAEMQGLETASASAQRIMQSTKGVIEQLRGSSETLVTDVFLPFLERGLEPFVRGITYLVNVLNDVPKEFKEFLAGALVVIPVIVSLVAGVGLAAAGILRLSAGLTTLSQAYGGLRIGLLAANFAAFGQALAIAVPALSLIVGGIGVLTVAFNTFYKVINENIGGAGDAFGSFLRSVKEFFSQIGVFFNRIRIVFDLVFGQRVQRGIASAGDIVANLFDNLTSGIKSLIARMEDLGVFDFLIERLVMMRPAIESVIKFVTDSVTVVKNVVEGLFGIFAGLLRGKSPAEIISEGVFGPIATALINLGAALRTAWENISSIISSLKDGLTEIFVTLISGGRGVEGVSESLGDFVQSIIVSLRRFVDFLNERIFTPIRETLPVVLAGLNDFIRTVLDITAPLREMVTVIGEQLFGVLSDLADFFSGDTDIGGLFQAFIDRLVNNIIPSVVNGVAGTVQNLGEELGSNFLLGLADAIRQGSVIPYLLSEAGKLILRVAQAIYDALVNLPTQIYELGISTGSDLLKGIAIALRRGNISRIVSLIATALGNVLTQGIQRAFEIASQAIDEFLDQFGNRVVGGIVLFIGTALIAAVPFAIKAALPKIIAFVSATGFSIGKLLGTSISLGFISFPLGLGAAAIAGVVGYIALIANTVANDPDGNFAMAGEQAGSAYADGLTEGVDRGADELERQTRANVDRIRNIWDTALPFRAYLFNLNQFDDLRDKLRDVSRSYGLMNDAINVFTKRAREGVRNAIGNAIGEILPGNAEAFIQSLAELPVSAIGSLFAAMAGSVEYLFARLSEFVEFTRGIADGINEIIYRIALGLDVVKGALIPIIAIIGTLFSVWWTWALFQIKNLRGQSVLLNKMGIDSRKLKQEAVEFTREILRSIVALKDADKIATGIYRLQGLRQKGQFIVNGKDINALNDVDANMAAIGEKADRIRAKWQAIKKGFHEALGVVKQIAGTFAVIAVGDAISKGLVKFFDTRQLGDLIGGSIEALLVTVSDTFFEPFREDFTEGIQNTIRQIEFIVGHTIAYVENQFRMFGARIRTEAELTAAALTGQDVSQYQRMRELLGILDDMKVSSEEFGALMRNSLDPQVIQNFSYELDGIFRQREIAGEVQKYFTEAFQNGIRDATTGIPIISPSLFRGLARSNRFEETFNSLFNEDFGRATGTLFASVSSALRTSLNLDGLGEAAAKGAREDLESINPIQLFDYIIDEITPEQIREYGGQLFEIASQFNELGALDDSKLQEIAAALSITSAEVLSLSSSLNDLKETANLRAGEGIFDLVDQYFASDDFISSQKTSEERMQGILDLADDAKELAVSVSNVRRDAADAILASGEDPAFDEEAHAFFYRTIAEQEATDLLNGMTYIREKTEEAVRLGLLAPEAEGFGEFAAKFADQMTELGAEIDAGLGSDIAELGSRLKNGEIDLVNYSAEVARLQEEFRKTRSGAEDLADGVQEASFNLKEFLLALVAPIDEKIQAAAAAKLEADAASKEMFDEYFAKKSEFDIEEGRQAISDAEELEEKRQDIVDIEKESLQEQRDAEAEFYKESVRNYEDYQQEMLDIQRDAEEEIFDAVLERDAASAQRAVREARKREEEEKRQYDLEKKRREEDYKDEVDARNRERAEKIRAANQELQDLITKQQRERQYRLDDFNKEISEIFQKNLLAQTARAQDVASAQTHSFSLSGIINGIFTFWENRALISQNLMSLYGGGSGNQYSQWGSRIDALAMGGPVEPWSAYKVHDTTSPELLSLRDGTSMLLTGKYGGYVQPLSPQNRSGGGGTALHVSVDFSGMNINGVSGVPADIASAIEDRVIGKIADTITTVVERRMKR
jgi:TP901 family phage tail tape measure protein